MKVKMKMKINPKLRQDGTNPPEGPEESDSNSRTFLNRVSDLVSLNLENEKGVVVTCVYGVASLG